MGYLLEDKGIALESDYMVERIDTETRTIVSYDEREVPYDLLVTVPLNMGADYVARSGLGNELNLVPVDKHTLLSKKHDDICFTTRTASSASQVSLTASSPACSIRPTPWPRSPTRRSIPTADCKRRRRRAARHGRRRRSATAATTGRT